MDFPLFCSLFLLADIFARDFGALLFAVGFAASFVWDTRAILHICKADLLMYRTQPMFFIEGGRRTSGRK